VNEINRNVAAKQKDCEADLKKAEPALAAAQHALNTLNKVTYSLGFLKICLM
jgi:dynein heavy chain